MLEETLSFAPRLNEAAFHSLLIEVFLNGKKEGKMNEKELKILENIKREYGYNNPGSLSKLFEIFNVAITNANMPQPNRRDVVLPDQQAKALKTRFNFMTVSSNTPALNTFEVMAVKMSPARDTIKTHGNEHISKGRAHSLYNMAIAKLGGTPEFKAIYKKISC